MILSVTRLVYVCVCVVLWCVPVSSCPRRSFSLFVLRSTHFNGTIVLSLYPCLALSSVNKHRYVLLCSNVISLCTKLKNSKERIEREGATTTRKTTPNMYNKSSGNRNANIDKYFEFKGGGKWRERYINGFYAVDIYSAGESGRRQRVRTYFGIVLMFSNRWCWWAVCVYKSIQLSHTRTKRVSCEPKQLL